MSRMVLIAASVFFALFLGIWQVSLAGQPQPNSLPVPTSEVVPLPPVFQSPSQGPFAALKLNEEFKNATTNAQHMSVDIRPKDIRQGKPAGDMPQDIAAAAIAEENRTNHKPIRDWPRTPYYLEPACLCHNPLYFEEANLERYGCSPRGLRSLQPLISAGNFFFTVPFLPYKVAAQPPRTLVATRGQFQTCDFVPTCGNRPKVSIAGVLAETFVIGGLILLIP